MRLVPHTRAIAGILLVLVGSTAMAAQRSVERRTAGLDAAVHAIWTRVPLREWTTRVAMLAGKPVILDRRIDPDLPVTRTAAGESLRDLLHEIAGDADAAVDELAGTIRIVPATAAGKATRSDVDRQHRLAQLPPPLRIKLADKEPWRYAAGALPRDLVAAAIAEAGLEVAGLDTIPHDHFPAANIPPLSLAERLDLVLFHFDRRILWTAEHDRAIGRIVPMDADLMPVAATPHSPARPNDSSSPRLPSRTVKVRDEFTLRLAAPLDQALEAIASQLDLEIEIDGPSLAAKGINPGEIVRVEVEKASRDELFDSILRPLGLQWKIGGKRLRVFAAETPSAAE